MPASTPIRLKFLIAFIVTVSIQTIVTLKDEFGILNTYNKYFSATPGQNQHAYVDMHQRQDHDSESENSSFVDSASLESSVVDDNDEKDEKDEENNNNKIDVDDDYDQDDEEDDDYNDNQDDEYLEEEEHETKEEDGENVENANNEEENVSDEEGDRDEEELIDDDNDEEETTEKNVENVENVNDEEGKVPDEEGDKDEEGTVEEKDDNDNDEQPKPHPFAGARDSNGKWGYVADVTAVRKRHIELYSNVEYSIPLDHTAYNDVCEVEVGQGIEKAGGFEVMQKIQIGAEETDNPKPKLLCAIYTYHKNHNRIEAVADSWGWKCDGFLAASTLTNETIGAVDLPHVGEEMYDNMWQKTRSIIGYIYDNYMDDYDFFWLGGDDYFMIVENVVNYLATLDKSQALFEGHRIPKGNFVYCGGGPGYVLNKVALKRFGEEALPECYVSFHILIFILSEFECHFPPY